YSAVRYQPTACIVLNCPTQNAELVKQLRSIWGSDQPEQHLLDSLLRDYRTAEVAEGTPAEGRAIASNLQVGAAMRLLYYYPRQSVEFVAQRLSQFHVENTGEDLKKWAERQAANGVATVAFLKAVAWCKEKAIQEALLAIFQKTTDPQILLAA